MTQAPFPAWRPGADGRAALADLSHRLQTACPPGAPSLHLRRADQWHVTLCFIGQELAAAAMSPLLRAFADAAAGIPAHAWSVERLAYWPQSGAIVALPRPCPALQALCDATRDAMRRSDIVPVQATTRPHLTLAYLDTALGPQPWLDTVDCSMEPLAVDAFELLFNVGGRYDARAAWSLTGTALPSPPHQAALF
ncbi:2'-5' RNA ligase family protein [Luteimonas sp. 3794]|uniref:2'-5' RNA ligase family protein n=1 Tax=Luteimonas sp. 3794 TaxID=2817730 RepID=UPI00285F77AC|nr:2'-5' RNA ligase family protein [Luteimonas sp. 3794]MDR6991378.1 2'-5' RNA ligase [Luteimonas sp. 3794]